jgi:hypothetical protein
VATREQLVLDGTALDSATGAFALVELEMPPPKKRAQWAQSGDSDGAALVSDPLFENREITAKIRIRNQAAGERSCVGVDPGEFDGELDGVCVVGGG